MRARTRPNNPIKFSNARSSLPFPAYHKIAELTLILNPDPFLHCMFVFQWNMIARLANVRGLMFNRIGWNNDHLYSELDDNNLIGHLKATESHLYFGSSLSFEEASDGKKDHSPYAEAFIDFLNRVPKQHATDTYYLQQHLKKSHKEMVNNHKISTPFFCIEYKKGLEGENGLADKFVFMRK